MYDGGEILLGHQVGHGKLAVLRSFDGSFDIIISYGFGAF